jgi:hypothetical protein
VGTLAIVLGLVVWVVAELGEICADPTTCWGNGAGSAGAVAAVGLAVAIIGLGSLISGVVIRASVQVTLVPDGEVTLGGIRVMVPEAWEGTRAPLIVDGRAMQCATGDRLRIGDVVYTVLSIDSARHWVTLRPVPDAEVPASA